MLMLILQLVEPRLQGHLTALHGSAGISHPCVEMMLTSLNFTAPDDGKARNFHCPATLLPSLSGAGRTDEQSLRHPAGLPVYGKCTASCDGKSWNSLGKKVFSNVSEKSHHEATGNKCMQHV